LHVSQSRSPTAQWAAVRAHNKKQGHAHAYTILTLVQLRAVQCEAAATTQ